MLFNLNYIYMLKYFYISEINCDVTGLLGRDNLFLILLYCAL